MRPKKLCFQNCFDLARDLRGEYYYCEGFAQPPQTLGMLFDHAWLCDAEGNVLDPTWWSAEYANTNYYGVAIDLDYVLGRAVKTKVYGVLGDWNGDILCEGLPDRALVARFPRAVRSD